MIKRISAIVLLALALAACGQSDSQLIESWIKAFEQGDIAAVESLTSTSSMVWGRNASRMPKRTILGRAMVNPGDLRPDSQRIQWHVSEDGKESYICIDVSVSGGKVKVWDRLLFCNEAGVYGLVN